MMVYDCVTTSENTKKSGAGPSCSVEVLRGYQGAV